MIPKSGNRFSDKIMLKQSMIPKSGNRFALRGPSGRTGSCSNKKTDQSDSTQLNQTLDYLISADAFAASSAAGSGAGAGSGGGAGL
jgi:hypothetical protein